MLNLPNNCMLVEPGRLINQNQFKTNQLSYIKSQMKKSFKTKQIDNDFQIKDYKKSFQDIKNLGMENGISENYINPTRFIDAKSIRNEHIEPFQIFCLDKRPEVSKIHPNLSSSQITSILGAMWRATSQSIKQYYSYMSFKISTPLNQITNSNMSAMNNTVAASPATNTVAPIQESSMNFIPTLQEGNVQFLTAPFPVRAIATDYINSISTSDPQTFLTNDKGFEDKKIDNNIFVGTKGEELQIMPPLHLFIIPRSNFNMEISEVSQKCLS